VNKKRSSLLFLALIITSSTIIKLVKGDSYCNVYSLITDKTFYYYYEYINVSATWETEYNDEDELIYIQIHIFDDYGFLKWNSSKYDQIGLLTQHWNISIQSLNLSMVNNPSIIHIKFFRYYHNYNTGEEYSIYLESLIIDIAKNNIICELNGFKENLQFGENLEVEAIFRYLSNFSYFSFQNINMIIKSNNRISYQNNGTTNQQGMINFNISTLYYLSIGENELVFEILNPEFINNSIFRYTTFVFKSKVYIEVIDYKDTFYIDDIIAIRLFYYYINYSINPLRNENIKLYLYQNSTLRYQNELKTNKTGYLEVILYPSDFKIKGVIESFSLILNYNGTEYFDNATISFNLSIIEKKVEDFPQLTQLSTITIFSIFTIAATVFFLIKYSKKKNQNMKLKDINFKY
jgi:hypothetical protein